MRSKMIPNPMYSMEQFNQFHHLDIKGLPEEDLRTELYRRRGWLWERPELRGTWLQERVEILDAELKRRWLEKKYGMVSNPIARSTSIKPKLAEGVRL